MQVATLGLEEILNLPRQYGIVVRALASTYAEMQPFVSDCFILVSGPQGHIIWREGPGQVIRQLSECRIAPGFACTALTGERAGLLQAVCGNLWVQGRRLPAREEVSVWIGRESTPTERGVGPDQDEMSRLAQLVVGYLDLKVRLESEADQRRQFAIERRKLETFYQLTSELSELSTPEEILAMVAQRVSQLMDAGTTIVYGHNTSETRLIPLCGHKIPAEELKAVRYEIQTDHPIIRRVYDSGQIKRIDDIREQDSGGSVSVLGDLGLRSVLMIPIRLRDRRLGVMVVGRYLRQPFESSQAEVLSFVAHQIALILDNSWLRTRLNNRIRDVDNELRLAKGMQALMVPRAPLTAGEYRVLGETLAAKQVGGDYFDYFVHAGRLVVIVADVMGKGVSAALLMAILRSHFRTVFQHNSRLSTTNLKRFSELVYADFRPQRAFATVLLMSLELDSHELSVFSGGHHSPLLIGPDGVKELVHMRGPALGLMKGSVGKSTIQKLRLQPGEALLAYSDGILDAVSDGGERFGLTRLKTALLMVHRDPLAATQLLHAVRSAIAPFAANHPDDSTLCLLHRNE